ncbi:MAG: hypothetical protein NTW25_14155 [Candidatus Kapabacteria bacterium]|nr:hypothetical protein [Candidatus Kapabacteria bacterium]
MIIIILCSCNKAPEFENVTDDEIYAIVNTVLRNDNKKNKIPIYESYSEIILIGNGKYAVNEYLDVIRIDTNTNNYEIDLSTNQSRIHIETLFKLKYLNSYFVNFNDIVYFKQQIRNSQNFEIKFNNIELKEKIVLTDIKKRKSNYIQLSKPIVNQTKTKAVIIITAISEWGQSLVVLLKKENNRWHIVGFQELWVS